MNLLKKIDDLRKELHEHNHNYYMLDMPTISDYDFDIKLKKLIELENYTLSRHILNRFAIAH